MMQHYNEACIDLASTIVTLSGRVFDDIVSRP